MYIGTCGYVHVRYRTVIVVATSTFVHIVLYVHTYIECTLVLVGAYTYGIVRICIRLSLNKTCLHGHIVVVTNRVANSYN
jgi:hypothetical protein